MAASRLDPCIFLPLDSAVLEETVEKAKHWALMHGICMHSKTNFNRDAVQFAPFVLLPSVFPRDEFEKAVKLQPLLNELMHRVAHDHEFLVETLKSTIEVDEFTGSLFKIYMTVQSEGITQRWSTGLIRSDYMLHSGDNNSLKQIEINTIASSFAGLSSQLTPFYRFVLQELHYGDTSRNIPDNPALEGFCRGLLKAWELYEQEKAVILVVVEDVTYNICDQRFHEFKVRELAPNVRVIRRSLTQIGETAKLGQRKELLIDGLEVAVVYYRSAYEPPQYHGPLEWNARLLMERSLAIKCPSIQYHLAGTKKVQQALAQPSVLERFLKDPQKVAAVREIFTGLYSLDFDELGEKAIQLAMSKPEHYVLKPQREGGGNNVYGPKVRDAIERMKSSKERTAWILMDRILPPVQHTYLIKPGATEPLKLIDIVSELGIYGVIIGDSEEIVVNSQVGHTLRTKVSTADEGGVVFGMGALDSPFLIDRSH
ncbi:glutathione synthetase [Anabrus simplex]|uniref:glutathione synthetase n=1 Tax=Anabrus simplex TaxID=316456 RepID=UPI0034DCE9B5